MTNRRSLRHPLRLALVTTVALGAGIPAAFALTGDGPARPTLLPTEQVRTDDAPSADDLREDLRRTAVAGDDDATDEVEVEGADDVRGNCDEAEHAGDAACAGTATPAPAPAAQSRDDDGDDAAEDVRGNCDEAEHAADAACAGTPAPQPTATAGSDDGPDHDAADDRSGSGSDHDTIDDRSGSGSGSGHGDGGDDRSGSDSGRG